MLHPWTVTGAPPATANLDVPAALAFTALAITVAVLAWWRPAFGIAALLVGSPFDFARMTSGTTITTLKVGTLGVLCALIVRRSDYTVLRRPPLRMIVATLALIAASAALSGLHAQYRWPVLRETLKDVEYLLLFAIAYVAFCRDPDRRPIFLAIDAVVVFVSLSALAEYAVGARSGVFMHHGGWAIPRIAGVLEGPNQLAGFFDTMLPLLVARTLTALDRRALVLLVLAVVTDLLTLSRGGTISVALGIAVVVARLRSNAAALRYAAAAALLLACGMSLEARAEVPSAYFSIAPLPQSGVHLGNRAELWRAAIDLWHTSPIVGVGAGNFERELAQVGLPGVKTHANSLYLQSLAEEGTVGLALWLAFFGIMLALLWRSPARDAFVIGLLGATIALALHQAVDDMLFFPKVASVFWLTAGVAFAIAYPPQNEGYA